jgi:energy-converting hydrogenase Eha subunit A
VGGEVIMAKVKKIKIISLAIFQALLAALVGLLAGIVYSFGGLIFDVLVSIGWISSLVASTPGLSLGTVLAFGALIGMPIIFASFGFILGLIEAILFNFFARWFGGIEINFESFTLNNS